MSESCYHQLLRMVSYLPNVTLTQETKEGTLRYCLCFVDEKGQNYPLYFTEVNHGIRWLSGLALHLSLVDLHGLDKAITVVDDYFNGESFKDYLLNTYLKRKRK